MSDPSINHPFASANKGQLEQMLAQAETYLNSQLQIGMAADQRALVFAGFLVATIVAMGGGASALLVVGKHLFLGYLGFGAAAGLLLSLGLAIHAARPVPFEYGGNSPDAWANDVAQEKKLIDSLREQAGHYAGMIAANNTTLEMNCKWLRGSQLTALIDLTLSSVIFVAYFIIRDAGALFCR